MMIDGEKAYREGSGKGIEILPKELHLIRKKVMSPSLILKEIKTRIGLYEFLFKST